MKLSNLLAHCLLGLVDCSSSLVLPKAKNSIPVQIFCSNIYSKFIKHRLWRRGSDLEKKLEIILQSYPLCCRLTWPPAPPMHCGTDHLLQPDTQPYTMFLWKDLVKITWVEPSFGCFDPFLLRVLIGTFTVHIKEIIRKSDLLQNLETKFQEIKMFSRKLILTCREIS